MDFLFDLIRRALTGVVDSFKLKNPQVFVAVVVILGSVYYGIGEAMEATLPDGTAWIAEATENLLSSVRTGIVFLLTLLGAHTPQPERLNEAKS